MGFCFRKSTLYKEATKLFELELFVEFLPICKQKFDNVLVALSQGAHMIYVSIVFHFAQLYYVVSEKLL